MDFFSSTAVGQDGYMTLARIESHNRSLAVPGVSQHSAIFSACPTSFHNDLLSFLAYIKTRQIPIFSVALPDVRSVLGRGASFFVNGAEMPESCVDEVTGEVFAKDTLVALKRAVIPPGTKDIQDGLAKRINLIYNEVLTMRHPPLTDHPNIVKLLGIGFEVEGLGSDRDVMPTLVPECAELGNLAEVLETAKREERPLTFDQKLAFCVDVAHGLEALHACDIIHGDVKCENVLVFEQGSCENEDSDMLLVCKLTDFGFSHLDASSNGFPLGGSPPWQAPECISGKYFRIESAKRTDIYSFGLLIWRIMLDGDPFSLISYSDAGTEKERRELRNNAIALLKNEDKLVDHVYKSLRISANLKDVQLEILERVIRSTLTKDPQRRELDMGRLIRLLSPDFWYQSRQTAAPKRISFDMNIMLLDIEKHYHELRKVDGVVKEQIARSFRDYANGAAGERAPNAGAAYQLAVCYAIGFGVPFTPEECLNWLNVAAVGGFKPAQQILPRFSQVFNDELKDYVVTPSAETLQRLDLRSALSGNDKSPLVGSRESDDFDIKYLNGKFYFNGKVSDGKNLLLKAAENCQYQWILFLLSKGVAGNASTDEGVTPLHFISAWEITKAEEVGRKLIQCGGDINATAKRGVSVGGTPLIWSVFEDRLEHSSLILMLGGSPTIEILGLSALLLTARLHLSAHMRLLLKNIRPVEVQDCLGRLLVAAASGESRFAHINRHGNDWKTAPLEILRLLQGWNTVFPEAAGFNSILLAALKESLDSSFGPSNTDIQVLFLDTCAVEPEKCTLLLRESIIRDNRDMFDLLIHRKVPATAIDIDGKTLLHICAQNPNNTTTITYFAQCLLEMDGEGINAQDESGQTPFMDALLARKWDLAKFLVAKGADPLTTNREGYNILGLIIQTLNLGAAKWALKYSRIGNMFRQKAFIVHPGRNISAIQEAAQLKLPRAHGMKTEVTGLFLLILTNFMTREKIDYRSDGILKAASALDIAAVNGNVHAVKALVKKNAQHASRKSATNLAQLALARSQNFLLRKNLERCIFIINQWDKDPQKTEEIADGWTKLKTLDESNVRSSWEHIAWEWRVPDTVLSPEVIAELQKGNEKDSI